MKIIGISSSPNYNGNTATLVREALEEAKRYGAEVEEIYLPNYKLEYCKGCFNCLSKGKCMINDDLESLRKKLYESDGIILGSPSYGLAPNAIMKNFIDRIGLYTVYTSILGDKYIIGISTAGAAGAKKVAKNLTNISGGFFKKGYITGTLGVNVDWNHVNDYPKYIKKAKRLGEKIVNDINSEKKYRIQGIFGKLLNHLVLKRVMKKNILKHKDNKMKAVYDYLNEKDVI